MPVATASQTIGPYWHLIEHKEWADLTRFGAAGERITITGRITDGAGDTVGDAAVEIWQASPAADARFPGYGRSATVSKGCFRFVTLKPEALPGRGNQTQAPHLSIVLLARGLMTALRTRLYFAGEALNETDPLLASIEDPAERATLIAQPAGLNTWHLEIKLQGEGETVFLDV
jgi:protocatechuate 3,4-dioxygenase alpha subunit